MGSKEKQIDLDFKKMCLNFVKDKPLEKDDILQKRMHIKESIEIFVRQKVTIENFNVVLDSRALLYLVDLYNKTFFEGKLLKIFEDNGCVVQVCFDNKCTKTAGKCWYRNKCKRMIIKLSTKVFRKALKSDKIRLNSGIPCKGLLECLLVTFEHEFTHALIACFCSDYGYSSLIEELVPDSKKHLFNGEFKNKGGHSKVFMTIVNKKFGHTKYTHSLFKHAEAPPKYRYLVDKMSLAEIKKYLKVELSKKNTILFNAGDKGIVEGKIEKINLKKLKLIENRDGKKWTWNVPYGLLLELKSESDGEVDIKSSTVKSNTVKSNTVKSNTTKSNIVKSNTNTNNNAPIKIPKNISKPSTKKSQSNSTNNDKPLQIPKKKQLSIKKTKKVIFKVKDKKDFSGPHENKYLLGIPKEYRVKFGKEKITDLQVAKKRSKELGNKSGGITKSKKYYSVRAGKILKDSATGEISWLKI